MLEKKTTTYLKADVSNRKNIVADEVLASAHFPLTAANLLNLNKSETPWIKATALELQKKLFTDKFKGIKVDEKEVGRVTALRVSPLAVTQEIKREEMLFGGEKSSKTIPSLKDLIEISKENLNDRWTKYLFSTFNTEYATVRSMPLRTPEGYEDIDLIEQKIEAIKNLKTKFERDFSRIMLKTESIKDPQRKTNIVGKLLNTKKSFMLGMDTDVAELDKQLSKISMPRMMNTFNTVLGKALV